MDDFDPKVGKELLTNAFLGMAFAVAAALLLRWTFGFFGVEEELAGNISLFAMFGFMFADPVGAWRGTQSWSKFWVKIGSGVIVAVVLVMVFNLIDFESSFAPSEAVEVEGEQEQERGAGSMIWLMIFPFLTIPIVFLGPNLESILSGKGPTGETLTRDDLLIGLTFPLFITGSFALMGLVAGALWLTGAPWTVGVLVLTVGVLCAVTEAWFASPQEQLPSFGEDGAWQPRAESGKAAWQGLGKAMRVSFTSALFFGGKTYTTIALVVSLRIGDGGGLPGEELALLAYLGALLGIALGGTLVLLVYGMLLCVTLVYLLARMKGLDLMSMEALAKQALSRLFFGGLAYVRPEIEEDEAG